MHDRTITLALQPCLQTPHLQMPHLPVAQRQVPGASICLSRPSSICCSTFNRYRSQTLMLIRSCSTGPPGR